MSEYPDSWARQRPKGYEPKFEEGSVINDGLALKVFQEFCCDGCTCKSESEHTRSSN